MYDKKALIIKYINDRLAKLAELGKKYSDDKINKLADNLVALNKPLEEVYALIDNKFSYQARKISHNNYLASLKEYYLSSIDKLKKHNNCYLLSYNEGTKVLEQAKVTTIRNDKKCDYVSINDGFGFKKNNSKENDYELIMSDIAYLMGLSYAKTYRMFNEKMEPVGIISGSLDTKEDKFLNLEEVFSFIKEESNSFTLKNKLVSYHDRNIKTGLSQVFESGIVKNSMDYVLDLFACLPDITTENVEVLKASYLKVKVFEILTNSLNNNLEDYGILIHKSGNKYTFAPMYNKCVTKKDGLSKEETICNFYIVDKDDIINILFKNYYKYIKDISNMIIDNNVTLYKIIDKVTKEHLEYDEYKSYMDILKYNYDKFERLFKTSNLEELDREKKDDNNNKYLFRIAPYIDNYDFDAFDETIENKGSVILVAALGLVLVITIVTIGFAIYIISKVGI